MITITFFLLYHISKLCAGRFFLFILSLILLLLFFIANRKARKTYFISISMLTNWANLSIIFDLFGNCSSVYVWWCWCCFRVVREFAQTMGDFLNKTMNRKSKKKFFLLHHHLQKVYSESLSYLHYEYSFYSNMGKCSTLSFKETFRSLTNHQLFHSYKFLTYHFNLNSHFLSQSHKDSLNTSDVSTAHSK